MNLILAISVRLWKSIEWINIMHDIDINYADFRRLDLNLLVAFDALLTERHAGRGAVARQLPSASRGDRRASGRSVTVRH